LNGIPPLHFSRAGRRGGGQNLLPLPPHSLPHTPGEETVSPLNEYEVLPHGRPSQGFSLDEIPPLPHSRIPVARALTLLLTDLRERLLRYPGTGAEDQRPSVRGQFLLLFNSQFFLLFLARCLFNCLLQCLTKLLTRKM